VVKRNAVSILLFVLMTCSGPTFAEPIGTAPDETVSKEKKDPYKAWYIIMGGSNVHPGLKKSEQFINQKMNGPLNLLFWDWRRPTTFRNWRDSFFLWEPYIGIVKGIDEHFTIFLTGGVIGGTLTNKSQNHLLVIPMKTTVKFGRFAEYATLGFNYYPFERPNPESLPEKFSIKQTFAHAKPFAAFGLTAMRQVETGSASIAWPSGDRIYKQRERFDYRFGHVSARLGLELPINKRDSVTASAGYAFCQPHPEEFSGPVMGLFFMHRF